MWFLSQKPQSSLGNSASLQDTSYHKFRGPHPMPTGRRADSTGSAWHEFPQHLLRAHTPNQDLPGALKGDVCSNGAAF